MRVYLCIHICIHIYIYAYIHTHMYGLVRPGNWNDFT